MTILRRAVTMAARRLISDPVVQAKAKEFVQDEVVPRVGQAMEKAQPVIAETKQKMERTVNDLRGVAVDHPPQEDPKAFIDAAREKFRKRN